MEKKDRAIVFCATSDMTFAIASVMMDLRRYCPNIADEIVIFHDGIGSKDQRLLNEILPTRFLRYVFPFHDSRIFHQGTLNYFSKMVYSKFECFGLLKEYKKVLYTDYDIVIREDISELFDDEENLDLIISNDNKVRDQFFDDIEGYDMGIPGISTALIYLRDTLPGADKYRDWCYERTRLLANRLRFPEQGIFDLLLQEFNLRIRGIDHDAYCSHPILSPKAATAKILHAWGRKKFWNGLDNKQWNTNYLEWLRMGGKKYKRKPNWPLSVRIKRKILKTLNMEN